MANHDIQKAPKMTGLQLGFRYHIILVAFPPEQKLMKLKRPLVLFQWFHHTQQEILPSDAQIWAARISRLTEATYKTGMEGRPV